jgi:acetyl-CoA synthetase/medium-chain acyl-CoA synthetase
MTQTMTYEQARRHPSLEVPEFFNFTRDVIDAWAKDAPTDRALIAVGADDSVRRFSIGDISAAADRAAGLLRKHGVGAGDRVFLQLPRIPEWYAAILGCFKLGAVPIPGTTQLTSHDIEYRLQSSSAIAAIVDGETAPRVDDVARNCPSLTVRFLVGDGQREGWTDFGEAAEPLGDAANTRATDPLLIYFTSGTTAHPKMVLHTQASLGIGHELTARYWHSLSPGDLHWTVSDFGWAKAAWGKLFGAWRLRAGMFLWNIVGKPDYDKMMRLIGDHEITSFCAPPTIYRSLVQMSLGDYDWSSLKHCTAAGEPLNPEVISAWREATGLTIYDGYGQTETVCLVANYPWMEVRPGSMGRPMPGFDVDVVDDDGNRLAAGEEGHIAVHTNPRPVGLFREYWLDEARTNAVFRNDWYFTGDKATKDDDGYFWFVGRSDDVILSAGYRIGPFEVESALIEHPACVEAAVIGVPDPQRGEIVKAYVILADGAQASDDLVEELQAHVKKVTAPYKYPREIEFVTELPKTVSGKIRRVELRAREAELRAPTSLT